MHNLRRKNGINLVHKCNNSTKTVFSDNGLQHILIEINVTHPRPLLRPIASTSSMYIIHGDRSRASLNKSLTRAAPKPDKEIEVE